MTKTKKCIIMAVSVLLLALLCFVGWYIHWTYLMPTTAVLCTNNEGELIPQNELSAAIDILDKNGIKSEVTPDGTMLLVKPIELEEAYEILNASRQLFAISFPAAPSSAYEMDSMEATLVYGDITW